MRRALWVMWLLLLAACVHGRTGESGNLGIAGQVVDATGLPLAEVDVQVEDPRSHERLSLSTDADGRFELTFLLDASGQRQPLSRGQRVRISAWRAGFSPGEQEVRYPGGWLVIQPLVMASEALDVSTESLPALSNATGEPLHGDTSRSGRGE